MSRRGFTDRAVATSRRRIMLLGAAFATASVPAGRQLSPTNSATVVTADSTCVACSNFFVFANKTWLDTASIPPTMSDWGAWSSNEARVLAQLHAILDSAATVAHSRGSSSPGSSPAQWLGVFDASCMDSVAADRSGVRPLASSLAQIDSIDRASDVIREIGRLNRDGVPAVFRFGSEVNRTGDLRYVAMLEQSRLPLASSDYVGADSAAIHRRNAYSAHIARTFALAGASQVVAERDAARVLAIESALAAASMTRVQQAAATLADTYHAFTLEQLEALSPGLSWSAYLRERRAVSVRTVIISQPSYVGTVAKLVAARPVAEWRAFLRWQLLADASPYLSSAFVAEAFRYSRETTGIVAQPPRWERCARETSDDLPELLGHAYAVRAFSASSKARIDAMVAQLRAVLIERLATVPWLTGTPRAAALAKAKTFGVKIGYPDAWHDYSTLRLTQGAGRFVIQRNEARRFENDRLMARIGRAPIAAQWDFHGIYHFIPQSPTAWANWNEIIFPAAYLQAPLYDSAADLATNFGGIGVVIGHEMTHLFTADGGDIDARGKIHHWWTTSDSARFAAVQQRIVHQYDAYTVVDSATHVNGALTLDENLADIGGVELAYAALERALARTRPRATRDTTPEMRFFLAYARSRVSKSRPQYLRQQVLSDGHAPSEPRVNGPLSDFIPFSQAFHCRPGDPMVRPAASRVHIW